MPATNFTPIQLYRSTTASQVPTSGNLSDGELAINTNDEKLYFKNSGGTVKLLASSAGASGDVVGPASATDNAVVRFDGTTGKLVQNSVVTIADSTGDVAGVGALTMGGNLTLSGGTANGVLYLNGSKVATSGSALTFDGAILGVNGVSVGRGAGAVSTNTAVGASALAANTSGGANFAGGYLALDANTTGSNNIAVGANSLGVNTTGNFNVAIGDSAMASNTTANDNVAIGQSALDANTTGASNVALGRDALGSNTTASNNVAVGYQAAYSTTTAANNTAVGSGALYTNSTGVNNTSVGASSMRLTTTGANNAALGYGALDANTTGAQNTAIGSLALLSNTTASNNTAMGYQAGYSNNAGSDNVYIGKQAGYGANTIGAYYNTFVGSEAGYGAATAEGNSAFGALSLRSLTTGINNTAVGRDSLRLSTTGSNNLALGFQALYSNTTASNNTAVGYQAGYTNSTGTNLATFGYQAGYSTTADYNNFFGYRAGYTNTTGTANSAVGTSSLYYNTTGSYNTAIGNNALQANTTASRNTAVGYQSGYSNTTGQYSVHIGHKAGYSQTAPSGGNTFIGDSAGYSATTGEGNTVVGTINSSGNNPAGYELTTGSRNSFFGATAGSTVTTGSKNTILGAYNGNQGGLDIRTASNYIVLSDGDGNPRVVVKNVGVGEMTVGSQGYSSPDGYEQVSAVNTANSASAFLSAVAVDGGQAGLRLRSGVGTTYRATRIDFFQTPVSASVPRWTLINDYDQNNTNDMRLYSGVYANYVQRWKADGTTTVSKTLGVGDAAGSTSGAGITFPASQNASSDANTLDDYEEGTWTPTVGGNAVMGIQAGDYIKIGKLVWINFDFSVVTLGTGSNKLITGLPFPFNGGQSARTAGSVNYFVNLASTASAYYLQVDGNGIYLDLNNAASSNITDGPVWIQSGTRIMGTIMYQTSN